MHRTEFGTQGRGLGVLVWTGRGRGLDSQFGRGPGHPGQEGDGLVLLVPWVQVGRVFLGYLAGDIGS